MYILGINAYHGDAAAALIKDGRIVAAVEEERFNRIKHCAGFPNESVKYCLRTAGIEIDAVDHVGISRDPSDLHKKVLFAARRLTHRGTEARRGQRAVSRKQAAEDRSVPPALAGGPSVRPAYADETSALPGNALSGNGNGRGLLRQIRDRLGNAAKVRDLSKELAMALGVADSKLRAQFHNIEHHRAHLASSFFVSPFERAALLSIDGFGDFVSTMWAAGAGNSIDILGQV